MVVMRHSRIINYWVKIVSGNKNLYVNQLYMCSFNSIDRNNNNNNWARNVKKLLSYAGYADVWRAQSVTNPDAFCKHFKVRLWDIFRQEWSARISLTSKGRFLHAIHEIHKFNEILDVIEDQNHRNSFCRLVSSSHRLGVETGRWTRPITPFENRKCRNCNKIDDEYHFLMECRNHDQLRKN